MKAAHSYLTQAEVNHLPQGTRVRITWSGGNGPHEYVIRDFDGNPYAARIDDGVVVGPIYGVGPRQPLTQVEIVAKTEVAT